MKAVLKHRPAGSAAAGGQGGNWRGVIGAAPGLGGGRPWPSGGGGLARLARNVSAASPLVFQQQRLLITQPTIRMIVQHISQSTC